MKRAICIILALCLCLSLAACGGGRGVKAVQTLVEQEYSIAFRPDDPIGGYVVAAIEVLAAEGKVDELAIKWFGERAVDFPKDAKAMDNVPELEPRDLIVGMDINSFPLAYMTNGEFWGYDVELATAAAEKLGWGVKFQAIEKENVYIELSSGNIDCAWGGVALNESELSQGLYVQFGPYMKNDIVIAVRNGTLAWNRLMLSGKTMTMCSTTEAMDALNSDEKLAGRLKQVTRLAGGTTECFQYLYSGKCDAVLTDSTALLYFNCH